MPQEVFRAVFDRVLDMCQEQGLLKGRAIGTDSTLVDASASMDSLAHKELGCTYEEYMLALRRQDAPDASKGEAIQADRDREGKAGNADWASTTDRDARVMQHADGHTHLSYKVDTCQRRFEIPQFRRSKFPSLDSQRQPWDTSDPWPPSTTTFGIRPAFLLSFSR